MKHLLLAALMALSLSGGARASVVQFDLDGVVFEDGGTAFGSFVGQVFHHTFTKLLSVDITTTAGTESSGTLYDSPLHYSGGSISSPFNLDFLDVFTPSLSATFAFYAAKGSFGFLAPFSIVPALFPSREAIHPGLRLVSFGSLIPREIDSAVVPLPATLPMLAGCVVVIGTLSRRSVLSRGHRPCPHTLANEPPTPIAG